MTGTKILMTLMGMEIGGAETHVLDLSKALVQKGLKVYVASNGGAYEPELARYGITHYKVPLHNKRISNMVFAYRSLKKIITQNEIGLVHVHARIPGFICGLLQKKLKFRFVTTAHWVFKAKFPFNILSNWGEKSLAVSDDIRRYLIDNYRLPYENILMTVNGIDTGLFSPGTNYDKLKKEYGFTEGERRIVCLSRLDKDRSLTAHLLIQAAPMLSAEFPDIKFYIVGDGDDFNAVKNEAETLNKRLSRQLAVMVGATTDSHLWAAAADIFVNCSRSALEAMSSGKPLVASGNEGYLGLITKDNLHIAMETNFCFRGCEKATQEKLAADLRVLLTLPPGELNKIGERNMKIVHDHYSIGRMAEDAISLYKLVLGTPPPLNLSRRHPADVIISGYYGYNNSGDDMLLQSIINNLRVYRPEAAITVLSKKPGETRKVYGVNAIYRFNLVKVFLQLRRAGLLITGGGSLIQDETSTHSLIYYLLVINTARRLGVKNMLYANGIGPVLKQKNIMRARKALNRVQLITLRDKESLQILNKIGVDAPEMHITADPAFTLPAPSDGDARDYLASIGIAGKFFCIAIREWINNPPSLEKELAEFADHISGTYQYKALFLLMRPIEDLAISERVISLMKTPGHIVDVNHARVVVGLSEFVLGMRLHSLIYAVEKAIPVIGLVYGPKVRQLMDTIGQPYYMPIEKVDAKTLIGYANDVHLNYSAIKKEISEAGERERHNAMLNASLCARLMGWSITS